LPLESTIEKLTTALISGPIISFSQEMKAKPIKSIEKVFFSI